MFTHTQRSKFYDLSCSDCLRLKVTGFKRNYLPYLSVLPFCLVALSTSFAFNSEAAEVPQLPKIQLTRSAGGISI